MNGRPQTHNARLRQIGKWHTYLFRKYGDDWLREYVMRAELRQKSKNVVYQDGNYIAVIVADGIMKGLKQQGESEGT